MKLDSLEALFLQELKDLYSAENQLVKALPKMAKAASSEALRTAFQEHLEVTRNQVERLNKVFEYLEVPPKGVKCLAMEGLIAEGKELLEAEADAAVLDAALIAAAQKIEHYEISGYGTLRTWASLLGYEEVETLLQETLDEEKEADEALTELAETVINLEAEGGEAEEGEAEEDFDESEEPEEMAGDVLQRATETPPAPKKTGNRPAAKAPTSKGRNRK